MNLKLLHFYQANDSTIEWNEENILMNSVVSDNRYSIRGNDEVKFHVSIDSDMIIIDLSLIELISIFSRKMINT